MVLGAGGTAFFSGMKTALSVCDKLIFDIDIKNQSIKQGIVFRPDDNIHLCISLMLTGEIVSEVLLAIGIFYLVGHLGFTSPTIVIPLMLAIGIVSIVLFKTVPSSIFATHSNLCLRKYSPIANVMSNLIYPWLYVILFSAVSRRVKKDGTDSLRELMPNYNLPHHDKTTYRSNNFRILRNALDFSNVKIRECLVPRNEIVYADIHDSIASLSRKFINSGFSKVIICNGSIDNVVGYVNAIKLFMNPESIDKIMTNVIEVPESMTADKLFKQFIKKRLSVATVIDEFGGIAGMLTVEDIIEEITGEIDDEHDTQELVEKQTAPNEYIFAGRLEIDYINEKYKIGLPKSDEYETLAGYILKLNEDIPNNGDDISDGRFEIKILQVRKPKINLIRLRVND